MTIMARERETAAIAHAAGHAEPMVLETVRALRSELHAAHEVAWAQDPVASARWMLGRLAAVVVLVAGLALASVDVQRNDDAIGFRRGASRGYVAAMSPVESLARQAGPIVLYMRPARR